MTSLPGAFHDLRIAEVGEGFREGGKVRCGHLLRLAHHLLGGTFPENRS